MSKPVFWGEGVSDLSTALLVGCCRFLFLGLGRSAAAASRGRFGRLSRSVDDDSGFYGSRERPDARADALARLALLPAGGRDAADHPSARSERWAEERTHQGMLRRPLNYGLGRAFATI
jgi:hypothetical protein